MAAIGLAPRRVVLTNGEAGIASAVTLESIINTDELKRRPAPGHAAQNRALAHLSGVLAHSPREILPTLTDEAPGLCVVAFSALSGAKNASKVRAAGFDHHMTKPLDLQDFHSLLQLLRSVNTVARTAREQ